MYMKILDFLLLCFNTIKNKNLLVWLIITTLLCVLFYQNINNILPERDIFNEYAKYKFAVDNKCEILRRKWHSNCTSVYLFHNGTVTLNRLHLLKFSLLFESRSDNYQTTKLEEQNVPMSPFVYHAYEIQQKGYVFIKDIHNFSDIDGDNIDEREDIKYYINSLSPDITSVLFFPIYTDCEFVGFVFIGYWEEKDFTEQEIEHMSLDVKLQLEPIFEQ